MVDDAVMKMVIGMSQNVCFLPDPKFFVEELFEIYGETSVLTKEGRYTYRVYASVSQTVCRGRFAGVPRIFFT